VAPALGEVKNFPPPWTLKEPAGWVSEEKGEGFPLKKARAHWIWIFQAIFPLKGVNFLKYPSRGGGILI